MVFVPKYTIIDYRVFLNILFIIFITNKQRRTMNVECYVYTYVACCAFICFHLAIDDAFLTILLMNVLIIVSSAHEGLPPNHGV